MTGIYIHVPFCKRKCPYCAFYSVTANDDLTEGYMSALKRDISRYDGSIRADTVYFGGGTPSLLGAAKISRILDTVSISFELCSPEITLECNPCTVDRNELQKFRAAGINRLSVGVQSLDDSELVFLGRLHDPEQARRTIKYAAEVGFENISADLMIGITGQTEESIRRTVTEFRELGVNHISAYMIKVEHGTVFDNADVRSKLMDDDDIADLYLSLADSCKSMGYEQYEISNFSQPGFESRHNLKYWKREEYIGFGPSAHSFVNGRRLYVDPSVSKYISDGAAEMKISDASPDAAEEYVMLGLRLREGISLDTAVSLGLSSDQRKRAEHFALECRKNGLCSFSDGRIALTPKGMLVSNSIITELLG